MLVKTSVKKNLYWEIKDKVFEESFNGIRMEKQKKKVKVYGIDSTAAIRARLIEILQERVRYHKDKFVAKILLEEMQAMEVKKSGKIEHSQNTHDDQVFSYLMALYVWYDGQNLMENFRISKTTLKTDEDIELEENSIEDIAEARNTETIDINVNEYDNTELANVIEWVDSVKPKKSSKEIQEEYADIVAKMKADILNKNSSARSNYAKERGIEEDMVIDPYSNHAEITVTLPQSLFDTDIIEDDDKPYSVVQGNLADLLTKL